MAEIVKQLLQTLKSVEEPAAFCTSGSLSPVLPGLDVEGVGPVGLPITPATARQLIAQAAQAPYGRGEETIVDTDVRRVWQLEPKQFTIHNPEWETLIHRLIEDVKTEFGITGEVKGKLYKMLIYQKGSFFAPHRDSEKADGMFATLVVCLPSGHTGGKLLVTHDRQTMEIDFGGADSEYKMQYVAFYADCRHEIKPVTKGYRVCLVYNLMLARSKQQPSAPRSSEKIESLGGLLKQFFADESRSKIAIPLSHEYTQVGLRPELLKGEDRSLVDALRRAAGQIGYHVNLALMTYHQTGEPDYDTMSYSRWGYEPTDAEMGEVFEEELSLNHWIDLDGNQRSFGEMDLDKEEFLTEADFDELPARQEIHEATGNEGVTVERWYHQAVVVLWPADRYFRLLARQGQTAAIPALNELIEAAKDPSSDKECRRFAREIIRQWKVMPSYARKDSAEPAAMLQQLEKIADADLVKRFIEEVLVKDHRGNEAEPLGRLADKLGWKTLQEALMQFVSSLQPTNSNVDLEAAAAIVADLCSHSGRMAAERKAVCKDLAVELEGTVVRWDRHKGTTPWGMKTSRDGVIESLTRALLAVKETKLLAEYYAHAFADSEHYDLHKVLIPLAKKMSTSIPPDAASQKCYRLLLDHCIGELEARTEKSVEAPRDWVQNVTLNCRCADCRELQQFLLDPEEKVHRFKVGKDRRKHLHSTIDSHGLDMTHATERTGSPQTLVCTKTRASYEGKKKQFAIDVELLKELRSLKPAKRKK